MALALNRYLCSAVLPLLTKCAPLFAGTDHRAIMIDSMLHTIYRLSRGRALTKAQRDVIEECLMSLCKWVFIAFLGFSKTKGKYLVALIITLIKICFFNLVSNVWMNCIGTFDPPCYSICLDGWYSMCPFSTNMQRCLSRFAFSIFNCILYYIESRVTFLNTINPMGVQSVNFKCCSYLVYCEKMYPYCCILQVNCSLFIPWNKMSNLHFRPLLNGVSCWQITMSAVGSTTACLMDGPILE